MTAMRTVAIVFALLAALIHVYIFVLESLRFDQPSTWKVFGVKGSDEAAIIRPWAFNQGFYNLFIGIGAALGAYDLTAGHLREGKALVIVLCGVMVGAAVVLVASDRRKLRAALVQGLAPLIAVIAAVGLPTG